MSLSQDYEWGAKNSARDRVRMSRDRILCALEDAGGSLTPQELARRLGLGVSNVITQASRWPAYFEIATERDNKRKTLAVGLHRHLVGAA